MGALQAISASETPQMGPADKAELIDALYTHLSLPAAVKALGMSLRVVMEAADEDEEFRARLNRAQTHLTALAEEEATRRAVHGVEEYVVANGKIVYVIEDGRRVPLKKKVYSDGLLQFLLKSRNREVFGEKVQIEQTHKGHVAIPILAPGDFEAYLALARGETPLTDNNIVSNDDTVDAEFVEVSNDEEGFDIL